MTTKAEIVKPVFRKRLSLFLFLLLLVHFSLTILYQTRESHYDSAWANLAKAYTEPLFTQNFKIFAPDVPTKKYKLFTRYSPDGIHWSVWENKGPENIALHQQNRVSAAGHLYSCYKTALTELLRARSDAEQSVENTTLHPTEREAKIKAYCQSSLHFYKASYYFFFQWKLEHPEMQFPDYYECALLLQPIESAIPTAPPLRNIFLFFPQVKFKS